MKIRGNTVGTNIKPEKVLVKSENLNEEEKAIARANIGAAAVVCVHFDESNESASMTATEIYEAHKNGNSLVLIDDEQRIYFPWIITQDGAGFSSVFVTDTAIEQYLIAIDPNGGCTKLTTKHEEDCRIDDTSVGNNAWSSQKIIKEIKDAETRGFKKAVETFCPLYKKQGGLLEFALLKGSDVTIDVGDIRATECVYLLGKNLYDQSKYPANILGYVAYKNGNFAESSNYRRTGYIPVAHLAGKTITLNYPPSGSNPGMAFYSGLPDGTSEGNTSAYISGGSGTNIKVPDNARYMAFSVPVADASKNLQIELGSSATSYEEYKEQKFTGDEIRQEPTILNNNLSSGWNVVYTDSNEYYLEDDSEPSRTAVYVECVEDIAAIVTRLREALG